MVDATAMAGQAGFESEKAVGEVGTAVARPISLDAYADLCRNALLAPAQSHAFVSAWIEAVRPDHLLIGLSENGRPVVALALETVRRGPFRVARLMGGSHANGSFPPCVAEWAEHAGGSQAIMKAIATARPDVDLVLLERLAPHIGGVANPLLSLPHTPSPNIALATNLAGGFDAVVDRSGSKRKRKKHRAQTRKFEAAGGFRIFRAETPEEVDRLWNAFLAMKEHRFRKMGIPNVFGEDAIRAFFRDLFIGQLGASRPAFTLEALEVGGILRAVSGTSRGREQVTCEFGAIAEDELSSTSPGDFLFHECIRKACEAGLHVYDFGVGDEPYKRVWCDTEVTHFDVAVPLTVRGRMLALALAGTARAKSLVKNNPALWILVKRLRRRTAGEAAPAED